MTLDEAIRHCEEVAWENDKKAMCVEEAYQTTEQQNCEQCAADHRQLADWLRELQQWRRVYSVCPSYEMCIPECKEGYDAQIAEYKRLLKLAVEDFKLFSREHDKDRSCMMRTMHCTECPLNNDKDEPCLEWRYANEAEKLLGERI